jgi:hypothetical protein
MGGLQSMISRNLPQTAVYWGNPHNDGYGGMAYDDPVEINCRWEDKQQILGTITGNQIIGFQSVSRAIVYVDQDLDVDGIMMLGELTDLEDSEGDSSGEYYDPAQLTNTYIIKRFEKAPALNSTTDFNRKAFLTPWLT